MIEIAVPALGMAGSEVYVVEWLRQPGDVVAVGDELALIETDKAQLSLEATGAGVLGEHMVAAETSVPPGQVITHIIEPTDKARPPLPEPSPVPEPAVDEHSARESVQASDRTQAAELDAGPALEHIIAPDEVRARERDPYTNELVPHSLSPRRRAESPVSAERVGEAQGSQVGRPVVGREAESSRAAISASVSKSWAEIPHFAVFKDIRGERLLEVMRSFRVIAPHATFTDVLLKAYALSLMQTTSSTSLDLGLAVGTPAGVAIPVIPAVATSSIVEIADRRRDAVQRANAGRLSMDDTRPATSTLSNLGAMGVDAFTAIVPVGQTSILTVGSLADRPVVEDRMLGVGKVMTVALNVDHRTWDGEHAASVLARLSAIAADPGLLLTLT